jgi:Flp pilus assembly pilin Flp
MIQELLRFWKDETGPELVEWAVVTLVLIVAALPVLLLIRGQLRTLYCDILGNLGGTCL